MIPKTDTPRSGPVMRPSPVFPRPAQLDRELLSVLREHSGLDQHRTYLGLSLLPNCPRQIVRAYHRVDSEHRDPTRPAKMGDLGEFETDLSDTNYRNAVRGYTIESRCKLLMATAGHLRTAPERVAFTLSGNWHSGSEREIITPLVSRGGIRVIGHTDGETPWGDLVEIKSMTPDKFERARVQERLLPSHFTQVQGYMHFGKYDHALVLYVSAATFEMRYFSIAYQPRIGKELEAKARRVLDALDAGSVPACECTHCEE